MINAIIVDDEPNCSEYLEFILKDNKAINISGNYNSSQDALDCITGLEIDIAFLDIDLPEIDGLTLADMLLDICPNISVVFVTAYNQYAVDAFKLNALDYILKPISRERITETINRLANKKSLVLKDNKIVVNCFGKFCVSSLETNEIVKWKTSKSEELFAYLVSNLGQDVLIENISSDIFQNMDAEKAYNNIKTTIYYIKKTLSNFGVSGVIASTRGAYRIVPDTIECDYFKLLSAAKNQNEVSQGNVTSIEQIITSYKGGFLEKNCYLWAESLCQSLEDDYTNLSLLLCKYYKSVENFRVAERLLKNVLKLDPVHYLANKMLIELYLEMSDRIYALKTFDTYKRKLKEEFGEFPSGELSGLLYSNT